MSKTNITTMCVYIFVIMPILVLVLERIFKYYGIQSIWVRAIAYSLSWAIIYPLLNKLFRNFKF
jgi:hypothetical protein